MMKSKILVYWSKRAIFGVLFLVYLLVPIYCLAFVFAYLVRMLLVLVNRMFPIIELYKQHWWIGTILGVFISVPMLLTYFGIFWLDKHHRNIIGNLCQAIKRPKPQEHNQEEEK